MIIPQENRFVEYSRDYNMIPVFTRVETDLDTPLSLFQKSGAGILLESVESGENVGRYSILGVGKKTRIRVRGHAVQITEYEQDRPVSDDTRTTDGDPLEEIRRYFLRIRYPRMEELPVFFGGGIGYLGYEWVQHFEQVAVPPGDGSYPDGLIIIPRMVLVYDSVKRSTTVIHPVSPPAPPVRRYRSAVRAVREMVRRLERPVPVWKETGESPPPVRLSQSPGRQQFKKAVHTCLDRIRAGEIIQAVLSIKMQFRVKRTAFDLYRRLRILNPSPYLFYLDLDEFKIIGSSPEVMVRVQDQELLLKPIAGTRRRGCTLKEDEQNGRELLEDPKEKAEHLMLVDLGRNDLGRVARPGTVRVTDYMDIERYSHVMHIVSTIRALLDPEKDVFDVIRATFPAGTLSGAPKIRAMQLISELEGHRRGPYGGMIFNLGYDLRLDSCIAIRTMIVESDRVTIQAGAGIVADSDPEKEYREIHHKARALVQSVSGFRREGGTP